MISRLLILKRKPGKQKDLWVVINLMERPGCPQRERNATIWRLEYTKVGMTPRILKGDLNKKQGNE
jgi:hypothetical protein